MSQTLPRNPLRALVRLALIAAVLSVPLAAGGCASREATPPTESVQPEALDGSAEPETLSYLTGAWEVSTVLVEIDNEMMRAAADQPGAQWECAVQGDTMLLSTDEHEYTGALEDLGEGRWVYEASATYEDGGDTWTSVIRVDATQSDSDAFVGTMAGTIESAASGPLYTAQWEIAATRQ